MESDLIPYSAANAIDAQSVLVLAPHPDDETFGCGGAIAAHTRQGVPVQVVILTDGAKSGDPAARAKECRQAGQILGYGAPQFWDLPDRALYCTETLVLRLIELLQERPIDLVYAPSPWEIHPDHRQTCTLAMEAVVRAGTSARLAFYEVGAPLRPNLLVDISAHLEAKNKAMQCFSSQLACQDYAKLITALNTYRTYTLPPEIQAAEAYWMVSAADLALGVVAAAISPGIPTLPHAIRKKLPLVSILIRSMDLDCLARALDSISLQTYAHIEVVVVAARPGHRRLPDRCGPFPLKLHTTDSPLQRSRAANKALDAAKGKWLLLLDDDDWLMPDHIARLARILAAQPQTLAAYTGISLVNVHGQPTGQAFDIPFDVTRHRSGNLMPIHAVLFSRSLVQKGCRFDELLDRYEDWDFWLQVSQHTVMGHLPGMSAVYQIHPSSGVHEQVGPRSQYAQRIYQKWGPQWDESAWVGLMERNWAFPDLEQAAQQSAKLAAESTLLAQAEKMEADVLKAQIATIHSSRSWRVTAPLRWLGARAKLLRRVAIRLQEIVATEGFAGVQYRLIERWNSLVHPPLAYEQWVAQYDTPSAAQLQCLREAAVQWSSQPVLSIVMPVYNPPLELLTKAVQSIQQQTYARWELCMADDASTAAGVWECLEKMAAQDARIKVIRRAKNGHISQASNSALELAGGDFIVLMDNDDILPPDALHWVADTIRREPTARILYSDEDKLDAHGKRFGPYFKPDWNHTLFMGHNMISHLGVYQTELVRSLGGFREGYEGSQDYDLALRCIEKVEPSNIVHIPRVLYHWRAIEGSTALSTEAKPYALMAAQRALTEHLQRTGRTGTVEVSRRWNYRWKRDVPADCTITLIYPEDADAKRDNPTQMEWQALGQLRSIEVVRCMVNGASLQTALRRATGELVALMPSANLSEPHIQTLRQLAGWALDPQVGIAGGTVRNISGQLLSGGLVLNTSSIFSTLMQKLPQHNVGYMGRGELSQELSAVSMGCLVVRRTLIDELGEPDPQLGITNLASTEWCLRLREHGLKIVWCPDATWTSEHWVAGNYPLSMPKPSERNHFDKNYQERYRKWLIHDPAYHDALCKNPADFQLERRH